ncbi:MAG TPA: hypothetical protein PK793_12145, partial [Syntrophales bacterium]|nr:hypothetical protein [Syntrophales bacterium]HOR32603.1 hypothetical protein [Syntrophales bacterium]HPV54799.1 hypothetical protein [Syntrophales bacterium]HQC24306.1 hypothetical protein [Syntrophales bacterium]
MNRVHGMQESRCPTDSDDNSRHPLKFARPETRCLEAHQNSLRGHVMNFALTEEQQMVKDQITKFAETKI